MNTKSDPRLSAIMQAKRELRTMPVPWHLIELAAVEISKAHPRARGRTLVELIMAAALQQWSTGMD
jgi:hypothetical protein